MKNRIVVGCQAFALAIILGASVGCGEWGQRTDLASLGQRDAASCVVVRGGDPSRAASQCENRGFAASPRYREAYLETTACIRSASGTADERIQSCS